MKTQLVLSLLYARKQSKFWLSQGRADWADDWEKYGELILKCDAGHLKEVPKPPRNDHNANQWKMYVRPPMYSGIRF
ncbi:MAG: hypothetical protein ACYCOU_01890 [Sulfobacillus sp.]